MGEGEITRDFLVIASSAKEKGSCLACIDLGSYEFVRPVPYPGGGKWSFSPQMFSVLDILEIPVIGKCESKYQPENYCVQNNSYWRREKRLTYEEFLKIFEKVMEGRTNPLLSRLGYLKISEVESLIAQGSFSSIDMVKVDHAFFFIRSEGIKPRLWIEFRKGMVDYRYKVTQPLDSRIWQEMCSKFYKEEECKVQLPGNVVLTLTGARYGEYFNVFVSGIVMESKLEEFVNF